MNKIAKMHIRNYELIFLDCWGVIIGLFEDVRMTDYICLGKKSVKCKG